MWLNDTLYEVFIGTGFSLLFISDYIQENNKTYTLTDTRIQSYHAIIYHLSMKLRCRDQH